MTHKATYITYAKARSKLSKHFVLKVNHPAAIDFSRTSVIQHTMLPTVR